MKRVFLIFTVLWLLASTALAADAGSLLNASPLFPTKTGNARCDRLVENLLGQITNENMTTHQKVVACYDWLINNCSYGRNMKVINLGPGEEYNPLMLGPLFAADMLEERVGVCDDYSCAFVALVRAIGLNAYVINGATEKASGGMTGHAWAVICLGDREYVFDPQIDDNIAKGGAIGYYRFCKSYEEVPGAVARRAYNTCVLEKLPSSSKDAR